MGICCSYEIVVHSLDSDSEQSNLNGLIGKIESWDEDESCYIVEVFTEDGESERHYLRPCNVVESYLLENQQEEEEE